ncbi:leucine-rich repeat domain-containing protein [Methylobacter sp. sgz302048]|uniref:leucine-rich repeat domain-containing protein n=1 Tax=Methylobacter sp. sgz302048 TaxID=3455945 RepID=UPI003FA142FA
MPKLALRRIREAKKKRLTRLELGNCALIELPDELFKLAWLEELILSDNWYEYTNEELARRKPESQIHYKSNKIESLSPNIRALKNLKKLSVNSFAELHDLSPLRDLQHLQVLDVSRTQVSDLSPLRDLQHLQVLDVSRTQVSDLSPLRDLQHLQVLDVSGTQVSDLSPLRDFEPPRIFRRPMVVSHAA